MAWTDEKYILFLNTVLAFSCSSCILIGLWPFQGLFHSWFWKKSTYTWVTHIEMAWFDVGCIGLFVTNLQALATFDEDTGSEAYRLVFVTNAVMHGLWGAHNFHQFFRKMTGKDDNTTNELRRPYPLMLWSTIGACGSATVRNIYACAVPMEDYSMGLIIFTWVWEWLALVGILVDFGYFLVKELKWGSNVASEEDIKVGGGDEPEAGQAVLPTTSE